MNNTVRSVHSLVRQWLLWVGMALLAAGHASAQTATTTALSANLNPVYTGQGVTFTATVSGSSPTGSVTFKDGATTLNTVTLSSGSASIYWTFSVTGSHSITATYNGNASNAASTSSALNLVVNPKNTTTTTLANSPSTTIIGKPVTLTASVAGSTPAPTGSVMFYAGASYLGFANISAGVATLSTSFGTPGTYNLTATYGGDTANLTSTSAAVSQTINPKATTTTTISASANPANVSQALTLSTTVTGNSPTGSVSFYDGSTWLGYVNLSSGAGSMSTSFSTTGTRNLTGVYSGDANNATSTSAVLVETVNPASTTTTLSCPASTTVQVAVSCTVDVATSYYLSTVAGQPVKIVEGSTVVGTGTLSYVAAPGTFRATIALPANAAPVTVVGSHTLQAQYAGNATSTASNSANLTLAVQQRTSSTTLAASPTSAGAGQLVVLSASVTGTGPTGSVTFKDGSTTLGTAPLNAGQASLETSFGTTGSHSLTAVYSGDTNNTASTSAAVTETVSASSATTTALAVNPGSVQAGVPATLTASVTGASPGGTVDFKDGSVLLGSSTLGGGQATLSPSIVNVGSHSITATYRGDTANAASTSSPATLVVTTRSTSTGLASALGTAYQNQSVALTASITGAAPSGSVTFKDGATTLGTAAVSGGSAVFNASFATVGSHSVTASYPGDANNTASDSGNVTIQVLVGPVPPAPAAPVVKYEYDANGNPTKTIQAPGVSGFNFATTNTYDALNRLKDSTNAKSGKTQFGYNGREDLTQVTDPRNLVTQYPRNGLGDATSLVSPDTGTATHTYDAAGNLKTRTDSRGVLATYSYDALNRLTGVVYSQSGQTSLSYGWAYDQTGAGYSNGVGRLTSASHPVGSSQYAYDSQGRLLTETQRVNATSGANAAQISSTVGYTYDAAGNLTSLTYPSGRKLVIGHTGGQPTSLGLAADGSSAAAGLISQIQWEPFGGPRSWLWQMASGTQQHTWLYDSSGRLVRQNLGSNLRDISYDAADRITGYQHYDATTGAAQTALDQSFTYDELGRLTGVVTATASWSIGYDANGNRTSVTLNGVASTYTTATTSNRLTSTTNPARSFGYDNAGNTTSDTYTATYNLAGRMATLTKAGTTTTYSVDGFGRRVRKFDSSGSASTVVFVYDQQGQLLGEYNASGAAIREYVWLGNVPVAVFTPDPANAANPPLVYYVHTDHLGTPRVVVDKSGNQRWNWLAEPFGTSAPNNNPSGLGAFAFNLRFPGQYADAESGLFYNYFRDYDASTGRYTQSDPIGLAGGINTYAYVGGSPVSFVDPTGEYVWTPIIWLYRAYVAYRAASTTVAVATAAAAAATMGPSTSGETCPDPKQSCPPCSGGLIVYRTMTPGPDGLPVVAPTARGLGVRPGVDIPVDTRGMVAPETGGMSVSPAIAGLPSHRVPRSMGGTSNDTMYCTCTSNFPSSLTYRPDPARPNMHGFVEPTTGMPVGTYQQNIGGTRTSWTPVP